MAVARLGRQLKRPYGFCVKMAAVTVLGLCFIFIWSVFSSSSSSITSQRNSFDQIAEAAGSLGTQSTKKESPKHETHVKNEVSESNSHVNDTEKVSGSVALSVDGHGNGRKKEAAGGEKEAHANLVLPKKGEQEESESEGLPEKEAGEGEIDDKDDAFDPDEGNEDGSEGGNMESMDTLDDESDGRKKKKKKLGPLFDPKAQYSLRLCSTRSKHNYIPCIDIEGATVKVQRYRHTERSCPRTPVMCLVPLPPNGYEPSVHWPDSTLKILYKNVEHPMLVSYIKRHSWVMKSGKYLKFPEDQSEFKGGVSHYLESIEEMVPDLEWGKNIRVVLDIGSTDASFGASLFDKEVLTLSLGLKNDLVDLGQVALERGFPALVSPFGTRRLPFPSGVFDAIHCGGCSIAWHPHGGKLLIEMNRILRPGGYFILSTKHETIEDAEAMSTSTASICWNVLAHKTDEVSEMSVKVYQKPESNDMYELRRKKTPPLCNEHENPDSAWYVAMKSCLIPIPSAIEQRGTEWPNEWPERLEKFPEWLNDKGKVIADTAHWKAIVNMSYHIGMGIDWSTIRNVMDMKASYGGFAAALAHQEVWVMNVVPVHAPDTLPIIYERGLFGVYHDWCEPFGTYPRSYDLVHADHLFARLKNRCKQPVAIVVEMDRILRPGGWAIIRDKVEILNPLEGILRSLHWEIRMTYAQDKEGILCAQKTSWRP